MAGYCCYRAIDTALRWWALVWVWALVLALASGPAAARAQPHRAHARPDTATDRGVRAPAAAPAFVESPGVTEFSGRLIVRPIQRLAPQRDAAARARLGGLVVKHYSDVDEYIVRVPIVANAAAGAARDAALNGALVQAGADENAFARSLMATGLFEYAHPDWTCYPAAEPDDPLFSSQWHLAKIHGPDAWTLATGSSSIISAVTDTGIDLLHPDLSPNRVLGFNSASGVTEADGGDVSDLNGHGTHVAGCAAAAGNNTTGVCGPAWNTSIMPVRVSNALNGSASLSNILAGARWAVDRGAKVVSSSYTGVQNSSVQTTGAYIKSSGGLYCYAAGNANTNWSFFDHTDVIVVGASDENDNKASFSGYGTAIDVVAPGTNILSTYIFQSYATLSGTSMATPMANGVLALIWSINPSFTPAQVEGFLLDGCVDIGAPGDDGVFGRGRIDAFNSVQLAFAAIQPQTPVAADDAGSTIESFSTTVDVLANDTDPNSDPVTIASFDAVSVNGGTVTRSVATGPSGRDELAYTPASGFNGTDTFAYTATDPASNTDPALVTITVEPLSNYRAPENPTGTVGGLRATYYAAPGLTNLPDFSLLTPASTQVVPQVNYPSAVGVFAGSGLETDVAATFVGFVTVPATAHYSFFTSSDDGSKLFIGTTQVVSNDGVHVMTEAAGTIGLRTGTHAIRIEFFQATDTAGLIVSFAGGGLLKDIILATAFVNVPPPVCSSDFDSDGFVTGEDFDAYVAAFEAGDLIADFDRDSFVTGEDFDAFVAAFEAGC